MMDQPRAWKWPAVALLLLAPFLSARESRTGDRFHDLPAAWAGDWDTVDSSKSEPALPTQYKIDPPFEQADAMIHADLTPEAAARTNATSFDDAPGSLCDPEGWFPFINYGYGFAILASPGRFTFVPAEPDTEGIRRVYFKGHHARALKPTWDGDSIASWDGETLVIDTIGYNDKSWLGDDRERHSTRLHMVERMRLVDEGRYLEIQYEIGDPVALEAPYQLKRYFQKYVASHIGAGPDRNTAELVCNEDPSPFKQDRKSSAH